MKTGHSYKQQLIFPLNFQKICHMTYKNRTKENKQTCAINGRLSPLKWCFFFVDGRSQQQYPPLFCSYRGLESAQLRTGRSTIHKFQATAFSSIIIVIYKVHALHFLIQPPKGCSPLRHSSRLLVLNPTLLPPWPAEVAKESPWLLSVCSSRGFPHFAATTPARPASSANLRSDGTEKRIDKGTSTDNAIKKVDGKGERFTWTWGGALNTNVTALAISSAFKHWGVEERRDIDATAQCFRFIADICWLCKLTFILSYTAAAFSGSLLWCLKANSVSTIPGDIHCRGGKCITNEMFYPLNLCYGKGIKYVFDVICENSNRIE